MFIELDLDDGVVILNADHIIAIDVVKFQESYEPFGPTHYVVRLSTSDSDSYRKTFMPHDENPGQYAYEYQQKLSRMLCAKPKECEHEFVTTLEGPFYSELKKYCKICKKTDEQLYAGNV